VRLGRLHFCLTLTLFPLRLALTPAERVSIRSGRPWEIPARGVERCGSKKDDQSPSQRQSVVVAPTPGDSSRAVWRAWRTGAGPPAESSGPDLVQLRNRRDGSRGSLARLHRPDGSQSSLAPLGRGDEVPPQPGRVDPLR